VVTPLRMLAFRRAWLRYCCFTCRCRRPGTPVDYDQVGDDEDQAVMPALAPSVASLPPTTGPRSVIMRFILGEIAQAEAGGASYVRLNQAAMDTAVGYTVPPVIMREVLPLIAARRDMEIFHDGHANYVLDWRIEDRALLANPAREGEPEDAGP
jgi:hypothetical protein